MGKSGKRYTNQGKKAILKHLEGLLSPKKTYNLCADPLGIYFEIRESTRQKKQRSEKMRKIISENKHLSKGKRKQLGTKKRIRPKIRSVKKGRTVNLKGVSY